jgi:Podovirus DNA encapsidation protein (Gp16).
MTSVMEHLETPTEKVVKKGLAYYNFDKIYSMNGSYNFLIGARGLGKTYGKKVKDIKAAITKGDEFIYLRRYKEELATAKRSFFADILEEFPDYDFRAEGNTAQYSHIRLRDEKKRPWIKMGYFMALSTAQSQKSVSFPKVKSIIFDEFIIEKGMTHYLPSEAEAFTNFFNTVDRSKDKTRAWFLANSATIENPYFLKYDIEPKAEQEWIKKFDGFIVCHFADSEEFKKGVYETKFGKFIAESDPSYAAYAVGNEFRDNNGNLVKIKSAEARYMFSLETVSGIFSVWIDWDTREYYIQAKRPKVELLFTLCPEKMATGKKLLFNNDRQIVMLRSSFKSERVFFDKPQSRQAFLKIFSR